MRYLIVVIGALLLAACEKCYDEVSHCAPPSCKERGGVEVVTGGYNVSGVFFPIYDCVGAKW